MFFARMLDPGIVTELQISRECALLGNYDTALLYYEGILATMLL